MVARLVECSDHNYNYGILTVENVSMNEVQNKIYEIKRKFYDEDFDDWCIDDLFAEFPEEWEWSFESTDINEYVEI